MFLLIDLFDKSVAFPERKEVEMTDRLDVHFRVQVLFGTQSIISYLFPTTRAK